MKQKKQKSSGKHYYMKFDVAAFEGEENLRDCDAVAFGVYIKLMCLLFNCTPKGRIRFKAPALEKFALILLKQNDKQNNKQIFKHLENICLAITPYFAKHLKLTNEEVNLGLLQLLENDVVYLNGDSLCQKRMLRDHEISAARALAGAAGGKKTQSDRKKEEVEKEILPVILLEDLLKQNDKQNKQQNSNYNSDYNYNYKEESIGGIGNEGRGVGSENLGEKGEEPDSEKNYEGNWAYQIPAVYCKHFFFNNNIFGKARDGSVKVLSNFYHPTGDDQPEQLLARLELWADEFNDFLDRTEEKNKAGVAIKMMVGKNCWPDHFHNWLNSQKARLADIPDKRIENQSVNGKKTSNLKVNLDIPLEKQAEHYKRTF